MDSGKLLADLRRLLPALEADLRTRSAAIRPALEAEWQRMRGAQRTAEAFEPWRDAWVTQVAVAWLLSLVCVRFLEDQGQVPVRLAGSGARAGEADEARQGFIRRFPTLSDADWLGQVLAELAALPGAAALFGPHNLVRALAPSGDMGVVLLRFFQRTDPETGRLVHGFEGDAAPGSAGGEAGAGAPAGGAVERVAHDTRWLGDLYQDLSEDARKRYALLQTPDFVEAFILDHTLDPAVERFGLAGVRLIDPTCGSGHFLLGAFHRLLDRWTAAHPGQGAADRVQAVLDRVWGVDVNPFAVGVARFRLLLAALAAVGRTVAEAPTFRLHVTVADSLLQASSQLLMTPVLDAALYGVEDAAAVRATFGQQYAAVVGNPPYITVKDAVLNAEYRKAFPDACHRQYSLGVPFTQQFFELAQPEGFVGLITANSFMKREFGKKLIEKVLPRFDLTHVIDTAGAYIPGHGTPTVILFGRKRAPTGDGVRAVLGIRGEPSTPAQGEVWRSIAERLGSKGARRRKVGGGLGQLRIRRVWRSIPGTALTNADGHARGGEQNRNSQKSEAPGG